MPCRYLSVFVGLREKGINFDTVLINLNKGENVAAKYAQFSTTLRVPTIDDKGFKLCESSAIYEYLEDRYSGTALYPQHPALKAKAREIQAWLRSDLLPIREERTTAVVFRQSSVLALSELGQQAAKRLLQAAEQLIPKGSNSLFVQWSIADTDLTVMLNRLIMAGDTVPARLIEFAVFQWQRPSVQEWVRLVRNNAV